MDTQEYGFRNFQELLEVPREEYEAMTVEERQDRANRINRAIDEAMEGFNQIFFGLCPDCKARRREAR